METLQQRPLPANRLPEKLSQLIRQAIKDLRKAERDPRAVVDMATYMRQDDLGLCHVCLAGAVMRYGLGLANLAGIDEQYPPGEAYKEQRITRHDTDRLWALDDIRRGDLAAALTAIDAAMPDELLEELSETYATWIYAYEDDPADFKYKVLQLADVLAQHGY